MLRYVLQLLQDVRGVITVQVAIALPALFCVAGVAVDYATNSYIKAELQSAGDAAALAGAREFSLASATQAGITSVVKRNIDLQADHSRGPVTSTVAVDLKKNFVTVDLELAWTPFFAHFLARDITPVHAHSQARLLVANTKICVLTLNPQDGNSFYLNDRAQLIANGCGVFANSIDSSAMRLDMDSRMSAAVICSAGGVKVAKQYYVSPVPTTDCPQIPDPLANRQPPEFSGCDFTNLVINNELRTLTPGVYCGLEIKGSSHVTFSSGTYVINAKAFKVSDTAVIEGENVGFYLAGDKAVLDFSGNATVRLSGPESGPLAGLLFFEDRNAPLKRKHRINSAHTESLVGTIYLPRGLLYIDPNAAVAQQSAYTAIVAYQLQLEQGPELVLNSDYGASHVPVPDGIKGKGVVILSE